MQVESDCWLCRYCGAECPYMQAILDFIRDSALLMSEEEIVAQVHENVTSRWPDCGMTREAVRHHISHHLVCPNMVAARSVRDLSRVAEEIRECVVSVDWTTRWPSSTSPSSAASTPCSSGATASGASGRRGKRRRGKHPIYYKLDRAIHRLLGKHHAYWSHWNHWGFNHLGRTATLPFQSLTRHRIDSS